MQWTNAVAAVREGLHLRPLERQHEQEQEEFPGTGRPEEADEVPHPMALSLPELECAMGHALGIYGDLEEYVGRCEV